MGVLPSCVHSRLTVTASEVSPVRVMMNGAPSPSSTAVTGFPFTTATAIVITGRAAVVALTVSDGSLLPAALMAETR